MAFSMDSKLGDFMKNPAAMAAMDSHMPGASTNPQLAMGKAFPMKVLAKMPATAAAGMTLEVMEHMIRAANGEEG